MEVTEQAASRSAKPGDILFGQAVAIDGLTMLFGCGTIFMSAVAKIGIIELRDHLERMEGRITEESLWLFDAELRALYLAMYERLGR